MEPEKDELLSAFENPDMATQPESVEAPVNNTNTIDSTVSSNPTEQVESAPVENAPVESAPVAQETANVTPDISQVEQAPIVEQPKEENQDSEATKKEDDDPKFLKKNMIFIGILFGLIVLFIIFLPKIMGIFGAKFN